jgi:transposase
VLDRGFVTEKNLRFMDEKKFPFIIPLSLSRIEAVKLIEAYGQDIRRSANRIGAEEIYGVCVDFKLYGIVMKAHIFFDPEKQSLDEKELYAHIDRLSSELEEMGKTRSVSKKYTDFFAVQREGKIGVSFERDHDKIDARLRRSGYFVILSADMSLSPSDVIRIYRGRDVIEKNFDQLKNDLDFKRLRTHINTTTEGKVFVGFLALILRSYLLKKIKTHSDTAKMTFEKVLLELKKIKAVTLSDNTKLLTPLTKTQKNILTALDIDSEKMISSVSSSSP